MPGPELLRARMLESCITEIRALPPVERTMHRLLTWISADRVTPAPTGPLQGTDARGCSAAQQSQARGLADEKYRAPNRR